MTILRKTLEAARAYFAACRNSLFPCANVRSQVRPLPAAITNDCVDSGIGLSPMGELGHPETVIGRDGILDDMTLYWLTNTGASSSRFYSHQVAKSGHFAAWEQPELFSEELRSAFRSLR
jgi:hypothetical protein